MTPFPRYARIGAFRFKIRWSTKAVRDLEKQYGHALYGSCDYDEQIIYMRRDLSHDRAVITLLHELLHAVFHAADTPLSTGSEERAVTTMAPILLSVLRDNPHIVEFLTTEEIQ